MAPLAMPPVAWSPHATLPDRNVAPMTAVALMLPAAAPASAAAAALMLPVATLGIRIAALPGLYSARCR